MHLGYRLAVATLVLVAVAGQYACKADHHECDLDTYGTHCEAGQRVSCEPPADADPDCGADEGCDTYITRTTCEASATCVADTSSRAVCQGTLAPAACGLSATVPLPSIGVSTIVPDAVVADFDGDGRADILTYVPTRYIVSLGNGDGTFHALPVQSFGTKGNGGLEAEGVGGLAVGDFDGDKHVDLAYVDFRPAPVVVVLLGAGNGTFHEGASTPACFTNPAVGDLDGDGIDDLIDANGALFGAPNGAFRGTSTAAPDTAGCYPTLDRGQIVVGDFDGDGKLDVADGRSGNIRSASSTSSGVFGPSIEPLGSATSWLAAGDADGDGITDLLLVTAGGISFRHGRKGTTLDSPVVLTTAPYKPYRTQFADVDGDGKLDVVSTDSVADTVLFWKNLGNSTFSATPTAVDPIKDASDLTAVSDFDHDGKADIVLRANRAIGVVKDGCGAL